MNCPKCGVVAAAGAEECGACGIVFSRWRDRPVRPSLTNTPLPAPEQRVPASLIIAGVIVFVIIGLVWTAHRRAARASEKNGDMTALLDDINNKGQAERERIRNEAQKGYRAAEHDQAVAAAAAAKIARQLPPTITEADLRALIEQDAFFQDNVTASVPKAFTAGDYSSVARQYPALPGALKEELIEFDPPFDPKARPTDTYIQGHVPSMALYNVAAANDRGDTYEFDVGRRRLDTLTIHSAGDFKIEAAFSYTYEHPAGRALLPGVKAYGHASLTRGASGWRVDSVTHQ